MNFLGIDLGSSFLKSSILDLDHAQILESSSVPTPGFSQLSPERREIPIDQTAEAVRQLIEEAAEKYAISGILFSVQMHGFMLFDQQGNALTNYISWQDRRGAVPGPDGEVLLDRLRREIPVELTAENGISLKSNHSLVPLVHYLEEHPEHQGAEFAMLGDGLVRLMTGQRTSIHPSVAASSGLYSLKTQNWNQKLLSLLHLNDVQFPEVKEDKTPMAVYHSNGGDIPIYVALGDHQAAVLGTGVSEGEAVINIGTGGQVIFVDRGVSFGKFETRPFFQGRTLRTFAQLPSGRSLNVLMNLILDIGRQIYDRPDVTDQDVWQRIDALRAVSQPEQILPGVDFSFFSQAGGDIHGITADNLTVQTLFRGAYVSMAEQYEVKAKALLQTGEDAFRRVLCTGGVVRKNELLFRSIQAQFSVPCEMADCSDDVMTGLLRYALWCEKDQPLFA